MATITPDMIAAAYRAGQDVHARKMSVERTVASLADVHRMNLASAKIYVQNLGHMLDGTPIRRTMSAPAFRHFLSQIAADYGRQAATIAVNIVRDHVGDYNGLGRGNLSSVAAACDDVERQTA